MKRMVTVLLMVLFSAAAGYAQNNPVKMQSSGPELVTAFNVQVNTTTCEEKLTGEGSMGHFTYLGLRTDSNDAPPTNACPYGVDPVLAGEGMFRFSDGSLMSVQITGGSICIDGNGIGHLTETYQVMGGTGRFQHATGQLSHTGLLNVVLFDASGNPLLLTHTGTFDGTIIGVAKSQKAQSRQQ